MKEGPTSVSRGRNCSQPFQRGFLKRLAMAGILCSLTLLYLGLCLAMAGMDSCYDALGRAQRCMPIFENAAFGRLAQVSNTCGSPPEDYCLQMGTRDSGTLCHHCDASNLLLHHNATFLTDFHSQEESTWWQSQSMVFGVQFPNSVNITLHLGKQDWPVFAWALGCSISGCFLMASRSLKKLGIISVLSFHSWLLWFIILSRLPW